MTSKARGLVVHSGLVMIGIFIGHFVGRFLMVLLHEPLYRASGGRPLEIELLVLGILPFITVVGCGLTGSWIGSRLALNLPQAVAPLTSVLFLLLYFMWWLFAFFGDDFLIFIGLQPLTLAALVAAITALIMGWQWPRVPILAAWVLAPLVLNPVIGHWAGPLFGMEPEGLERGVVFGAISPVAGVLFGLGSPPILWRRLATRPVWEAALLGVVIQLAVLALNLMVFAAMRQGR